MGVLVKYLSGTKRLSPPSDVEAAFAEFYKAEFQQTFRTARLILGSTADAEDVVHKAFLALWQRWETISEPGPYLQRSVVNGARSMRSRSVRRLQILNTNHFSAVGDSGDHEVLVDVLGELPFNQRSAVVLRYYAGLSNTEIAEALRCPPGSVGPWLQRGLEQLRKALS